MRVENPSLVVWKDGAPVLWRAGATACELVTEDTVFPEGVIVGLPSDDVRSTLLSVSPEERKHLAKSLPIHDGGAGRRGRRRTALRIQCPR